VTVGKDVRSYYLCLRDARIKMQIPKPAVVNSSPADFSLTRDWFTTGSRETAIAHAVYAVMASVCRSNASFVSAFRLDRHWLPLRVGPV
jgi:hypothetical protein